MRHNTSIRYQMKREIFGFSNKIFSKLNKPDQKFFFSLIYGLLAGRSCLITDISDSLKENIKKINVVKRLTRHLKKPISKGCIDAYHEIVKKMCSKRKVVYIDDSDIIKPGGKKFECLDKVRDGSKSKKNKNVYGKGYHVTEACALTDSNHPVSIFSHIHSSKEENYTSSNDITFRAFDEVKKLFETAIIVMDRGYDSNKIFKKLYEQNQNFIIRLTNKRSLLCHNRKVSIKRLCHERKGKIKISVIKSGKKFDLYASHVRVAIPNLKKKFNLIIAYRDGANPIMLATNREIKSKTDVIDVVHLYFSRWKIEEYFREKKQDYKFENFRVRDLEAIRNLNFLITISMAFLAYLTMKPEKSMLRNDVLNAANAIKKNVCFLYYRISKGTAHILSYARIGTGLWFKSKTKKKVS